MLGRNNASMVCAWVLAALWLAGCDGGGNRGTIVDGDKQPVLGGDKPTVGQSGSEGQCIEPIDGPANVLFDERLPAYGFSGADVAAAVDGEHRIDVVWQPWFGAHAEMPATRSLVVEIEVQHKARVIGCGWIDVDADVRLRDTASGIEVALPGSLLRAHPTEESEPHLGDVYLLVTFDNPKLAAKLDLPPAVHHDSGVDRFELRADFNDHMWSASLASLRDGTSCWLLVPPGWDDYDSVLRDTCRTGYPDNAESDAGR